MRLTPKEKFEVMARIQKLGVTTEHAMQLRRISNTLRNGVDIKPGDSIDSIYSRGVAVY